MGPLGGSLPEAASQLHARAQRFLCAVGYAERGYPSVLAAMPLHDARARSARALDVPEHPGSGGALVAGGELDRVAGHGLTARGGCPQR